MTFDAPIVSPLRWWPTVASTRASISGGPDRVVTNKDDDPAFYRRPVGFAIGRHRADRPVDTRSTTGLDIAGRHKRRA